MGGDVKALAKIANDLSIWRDKFHDCDCPPCDSCGCKELSLIQQQLDIIAAIPPAPHGGAEAFTSRLLALLDNMANSDGMQPSRFRQGYESACNDLIEWVNTNFTSPPQEQEAAPKGECSDRHPWFTEVLRMIREDSLSPEADAAVRKLRDFMRDNWVFAPEAVVSPFEFDRYINGILMAEGVRLETQTNIKDAAASAAKKASRGPNGEVPVLVLRTAAPKGEAFVWLTEFDMLELAMPASSSRDTRVYRVPEHGGKKLVPLYAAPPSPKAEPEQEAVAAERDACREILNDICERLSDCTPASIRSAFDDAMIERDASQRAPQVRP